MSLHTSMIGIKGDARSEMAEFFKKCGYDNGQPAEVYRSWNDVDRIASLTALNKIVIFRGDHTLILDFEMVLMLNEEPLRELSHKYGTVATMICEGASGSYGYSLFRDGEIIRRFLAVEGEIADEFGKPLEAEKGLDLAKIFEDDVAKIMGSFGFSYPDLDQIPEFYLYRFPEEAAAPDEKATKVEKKKWWKFW